MTGVSRIAVIMWGAALSAPSALSTRCSGGDGPQGGVGLINAEEEPELLERDVHDRLRGGLLTVTGTVGGELGGAAGHNGPSFGFVEPVIIQRGQNLTPQHHRLLAFLRGGAPTSAGLPRPASVTRPVAQ
ncbi:hypothetical protein [Streptomyces sp. MNP-20]|uniref:hypothetical protein n=1 Tax=Streptomyces sp. MNP-20 TaxID=2721165 RepID=UPI001553A88F|nr:hypothetical protein [Streptomyces sp. MNP-20]